MHVPWDRKVWRGEIGRTGSSQKLEFLPDWWRVPIFLVLPARILRDSRISPGNLLGFLDSLWMRVFDPTFSSPLSNRYSHTNRRTILLPRHSSCPRNSPSFCCEKEFHKPSDIQFSEEALENREKNSNPGVPWITRLFNSTNVDADTLLHIYVWSVLTVVGIAFIMDQSSSGR